MTKMTRFAALRAQDVAAVPAAREDHANTHGADAAVGGLLEGAVVLTLDGALPVEYLSPGDKVITRDSGIAVLRGVTVRKVSARFVMVRAGALGVERPEETVRLLPEQHILIRDWRARALFGGDQAMVPAARLCDGEYIAQAEAAGEALVYSLEFDRDHVIYADGLELAAKAPARVSA